MENAELQIFDFGRKTIIAKNDLLNKSIALKIPYRSTFLRIDLRSILPGPLTLG